MNKYLWSYSLWIGLTSGIYLLIYLATPLASYGLAWMTFVSLPIFFTAGAPLNEIPNYICSMIAGLFWGIVNMWIINQLLVLGFTAGMANLIDMIIITIPVGLHLTILSKTWLNKVPMVFGGLAMTFSQGASNVWVIGITLLCGILLGAIYNLGGKFLEKRLL